jgi:hypothetical protein
MLSPASRTETQTIMMVLTEKDGKYCYRKKIHTHAHTRKMKSLFSKYRKEKGHSTKRNTVH